MSQAQYTKIWNKDDMKIMEVWVLPTVKAIVHYNMPEQSTLHTPDIGAHILQIALYTFLRALTGRI